MNLDFSNISIGHLATHYVGNRSKDENIKLSEIETDIKDDTHDMVIRYFFSGFNFDERYQFSHPVALEMNEMFQVTKKIFSSTKRFIEYSQSIAYLLYQYSNHPKIKAGELHVALFSNLLMNDKKVTAIGIYKSENHLPFLKMNSARGQYTIKHDRGYAVDKIDKACLIINTEHDNGYEIL